MNLLPPLCSALQRTLKQSATLFNPAKLSEQGAITSLTARSVCQCALSQVLNYRSRPKIDRACEWGAAHQIRATISEFNKNLDATGILNFILGFFFFLFLLNLHSLMFSLCPILKEMLFSHSLSTCAAENVKILSSRVSSLLFPDRWNLAVQASFALLIPITVKYWNNNCLLYEIYTVQLNQAFCAKYNCNQLFVYRSRMMLACFLTIRSCPQTVIHNL